MSPGPRKLEIARVRAPSQVERFLDVPARVYRRDPLWVPPLREDVAKRFRPDEPFLRKGRLQAFVALDPDPIGRVVAAVDPELVDEEGRSIGLVGFFECVRDFAVARDLLAAAYHWLREQGITRARGPIDLSTHHGCLFLVDGFDSSPYILMPYNPDYYPEFWERDGWVKAKDAYAYHFVRAWLETHPLREAFATGHRKALESGVTFRPIRKDRRGYEEDLRELYRAFTETFAVNWSATPRSEDDFLGDLLPIRWLIDPIGFPLAIHEGRIVGFMMALPDYNVALEHVGGKLDLAGKLKFVWHRRKVDRGRILALGTVPEFRGQMVGLAVVHEFVEMVSRPGSRYREGEFSWVWEDNAPSRGLIESTGARRYKTYRIYERDI